ncbi:MAG: hypothetical protein RI973_1490 [Bacteroidota bacterium]|jgi:outer membrane protein OmpA-like peptidoglycan-associated protein
MNGTMRIITYSLLLIFVPFLLRGQSSLLKQAQQKMDDLDYMGAIELYNKILEHSDEATAKINLAEAYRKINDAPNAEFWYGQVVRLPESEPIHKLYYGMMLQRNGKCEQAKPWYQQYVDLAPGDQRGQYLLRACDYEAELQSRSNGIFEVSNCSFNSKSDDFSPVLRASGELVFCSERDTNPAVRRIHAWTGNPFLELYTVPYKIISQEQPCGQYLFGRPEKFSKDLNTKYHDASVAFSRNGDEIFFTRNNFVNGKKGTDDAGIMRLKVFYARSEGNGKWGPLQSLPFNSDEYSVAHPSLSKEGTVLYFASDMPGGFGGMDLYRSEKTAGRWGPPMNLGPEINTEGHEIFPFAAPDGKLYFASDGHVGLGGLDLYSSTQQNNIWALPINLGYPFNTSADDFSMSVDQDGTCGYFASSRPGGMGGDDIYSFKKTGIAVEVLVYDEKSGLPIEGAFVYRTCRKDSLSTNASGKVLFDMKPDDCCDLMAGMANYDTRQSNACTKGLGVTDKLEVKIPLKRTTTFDVEGVVFDGLSGMPLEGARITLENDCGQLVADVFTTTLTGRFQFKLEKDCCYKIKAVKEGYFAGIAENICTRGKTESESFLVNLHQQPISVVANNAPGKSNGQTEENKVPETAYTYYDHATDAWVDKRTQLPADGTYPDGKVYRKGVLTGGGDTFVEGPVKPTAEDPVIPYLLHVYYDFDQATIRPDAVSELKKLQKLLQENPQYIIEIGSHTDARGSSHYNQRLSQRRAESVVRWLTERGIESSRLIAKGYGETVNVNNCIDYVPCTEREHQMNRRTEFKVVGCTNCVKPENAFLSKENKNVKVNACKSCPF